LLLEDARREAFQERCTIWNGMIRSRPALVVRPTGTADVLECVRFARERAMHMSWVRAAWDSIRPLATGGVYVNFLTEEEGEDRVRAAYRDNFARLTAVKATYDPENLCRANRTFVRKRDPLARHDHTVVTDHGVIFSSSSAIDSAATSVSCAA
jgi:hypothetical protein